MNIVLQSLLLPTQEKRKWNCYIYKKMKIKTMGLHVIVYLLLQINQKKIYFFFHFKDIKINAKSTKNHRKYKDNIALIIVDVKFIKKGNELYS